MFRADLTAKLALTNWANRDIWRGLEFLPAKIDKKNPSNNLHDNLSYEINTLEPIFLNTPLRRTPLNVKDLSSVTCLNVWVFQYKRF